MEKPHRQRYTHVRPNGDKIQLDHVVAPVQWRNMVTDVKTVQGAALNSNHFLVKVQTNLRTKVSKPKPPMPKRVRSTTEEVVHAFNEAVQDAFNANADTSQCEEAPPQPTTTRLHVRKDPPKTSQPTPSTLHGQSFARLSNTRPRGNGDAQAPVDHPSHVGAHPATLTGPGRPGPAP